MGQDIYHVMLEEAVDRESDESLIRRIRLFRRGAICPSEMWVPLLCSLTPETAADFLDALPEDFKRLLREEYYGPARYRFEAPFDRDPTIVKIRAWCERGMS